MFDPAVITAGGLGRGEEGEGCEGRDVRDVGLTWGSRRSGAEQSRDSDDNLPYGM